MTPDDAAGPRVGQRIAIQGTVQGVGFRPWVYRLAREHSLTGSVRNDTGGVVVEVFGPGAAVASFVERLRAAPPPAAVIRRLQSDRIPVRDAPDFVIQTSRTAGERAVSIPPDLATCPECLAELEAPGDRRHGYAFINCTHCGPRFTIATGVPYDRGATTMAVFKMCPPCQREYDAPGDRRFHAQPNACPACGPRLTLMPPPGPHLLDGDPLAGAVQALRAGAVLAVKGVGGFHLAADATSSAAVARLRERKQREEKPFAVMVPHLEAARRLAVINAAEEELLMSVERPIVLLARRPGTDVAPEVAPGNPLLGLLLPYSPLHHLLLRGVERPLVMTSGNLSGEPLAYRNAEALERLGDVARLFLMHDREIATPCDDSVARVISGRTVVLRRARGYVPRSVPLARPVARPTLACGAHLKNAPCLAAGQVAHFGPHAGDLENEAACRAFEQAVERLERFIGVAPAIIAHDLHPDYFSTHYALTRPETFKVGVQHHHAHVAAAMGEHGLDGPVLGLAYDGTGLGTDGRAWGGELLRADFEGFERLATFRPIALPGGDQAVREVWRCALALLDDAFDGDAPLHELGLFRRVPANALRVVQQMLAKGLHTPPAHGVGRYFDAFGAFVLEKTNAAYEGQVAMELNFAADPDETACYAFQVHAEGAPWTIDLRAMVREAVADLLSGRPVPAIAARFHNTLCEASAAVVRRAVTHCGRLPLVLTGGCFQNPLLSDGLCRALGGELDVYVHGQVPPGDGGLALGQALVADALARKSL